MFANLGIALNHGFIGKEAFDIYAPAYALAGIVTTGATFAGILRQIREPRRRAREIALEIARSEGRDGQDSKNEMSRARSVLDYRWAINTTARLELDSEFPAPPMSPVYEAKSFYDRFQGFNLKMVWATSRDFAENPFYSAQYRGELFESAVELSLLEWQLIENDPGRTDQERTHAANMFLAIRRLRGSLLNP